MRSLIATLAAALVVLTASSCATPPSLKGMEWVDRLPRGVWVIEVGSTSKSVPCSPAVCQAGMNLPPYLIVVQYSNSPSGEALQLDGRVQGCTRIFRRSLALGGLEARLRQARYEQHFGEMISNLRKGCDVFAPGRLAPIELDRLILKGEG
ncbi:MAG TPA: hypothetical protein VGA98_09835 [Allosphingosinicella sp.]|jgi:hypothetical protein